MENKYSFENFIMQCCKASEWNLRRFLSKILRQGGFTIIEDDYKSHRQGKFSTVHNMLALRGKNPKICLVAHTDVCRDHVSEYFVPGVEPTLKIGEVKGELREIIQDKYCLHQVGGDDRLGVAINTWIALNTGYDMGLYFPTDEEIGLRSASACKMERLKQFELIAQVDRGNHTDELVTKINSEILAPYEIICRLLSTAYDLGMPRTIVNGAGTDVVALKKNGYAKAAVNMTCGYHNSYGAGATEYIDIEEATNTMQFVGNIVKDFYLNGPHIEVEEETNETEQKVS